MHNSKTLQNFHADRAECLAMANSGGSNPQNQVNYPSYPTGGGFTGGFNYGMNMAAAIDAGRAQRRAQQMREEIFCSCMQGKGWYLQEQ